MKSAVSLLILWLVPDLLAFRSAGSGRFYSRISLAADEDFSGLTVPKLKELLRARGAPVSGVKSELIARLLEGQGVTTTTVAEVAATVPKKATKAKEEDAETKKKLSHNDNEEERYPSSSHAAASGEQDELDMLMSIGEKILIETNQIVSRSSSGSGGLGGGGGSAGGENDEVRSQIETLLRARLKARGERDFNKADEIREQLESQLHVKLYDRDGRWEDSAGRSGMYAALNKAPKAATGTTKLTREEIQELVEKRTVARRARNFALADEIREQLASNCVELVDELNTWQTSDGRWEGAFSLELSSSSSLFWAVDISHPSPSTSPTCAGVQSNDDFKGGGKQRWSR